MILFVIDSTGTSFFTMNMNNIKEARSDEAIEGEFTDNVDGTRIKRVCDGRVDDTFMNALLIALARSMDEHTSGAKISGSIVGEDGKLTVISCTILDAVYASPGQMRPILYSKMGKLCHDNPARYAQVILRARQLLTGKPIEQLISPSQMLDMLAGGSVFTTTPTQ